MPARGIVSRFASERLGGLQAGYGFRAKRHPVRQLQAIKMRLEWDREYNVKPSFYCHDIDIDISLWDPKRHST